MRVRKGETGINGTLWLSNGTELRYWFENENREDFVYISHGPNDPQRIALIESELTFGTRSFFICGCGYRASKLYLKPPPGNSEIKCRKCHNLRYGLEMINRHSRQGALLYRTNRTIKAINLREIIGGRIFYRSRYTGNFLRYLALCAKAGLNREIEDAKRLMADIQA